MAEQVKRGTPSGYRKRLLETKKKTDLLVSEYAQKHDLQNLCRAFFNLSEFTYLD